MQFHRSTGGRRWGLRIPGPPGPARFAKKDLNKTDQTIRYTCSDTPWASGPAKLYLFKTKKPFIKKLTLKTYRAPPKYNSPGHRPTACQSTYILPCGLFEDCLFSRNAPALGRLGGVNPSVREPSKSVITFWLPQNASRTALFFASLFRFVF